MFGDFYFGQPFLAQGAPDAGGDVTVFLTGIASTGSPGSPSITGSAVVPLTGVASIGSPGEVTVDNTTYVFLDGVASVASPGSPTIFIPTVANLTGIAAIGHAGALLIPQDVSVLLTGQQSFADPGLLFNNFSPSYNCCEGPYRLDSIFAFLIPLFGVDVHVSGVAMAGSAGALTVPSVASFADDFNRANGAIGANWEVIGQTATTPAIFGNTLFVFNDLFGPSGGTSPSGQFRVAPSVIPATSGEQHAEIVVPAWTVDLSGTPLATLTVYLLLRTGPVGSFTGALMIWQKFYNNSTTPTETLSIFDGIATFTSQPCTLVAGDTLYFETDGAGGLEAGINGVSIVTTATCAVVVGTPGTGLAVQGNRAASISLDDFFCENS